MQSIVEVEFIISLLVSFISFIKHCFVTWSGFVSVRVLASDDIECDYSLLNWKLIDDCF